MFPQSTAQLLAQQYRERIPSPYVGMKGERHIDKKLHENEQTIFAVGVLGALVNKFLLLRLDPVRGPARMNRGRRALKSTSLFAR